MSQQIIYKNNSLTLKFKDYGLCDVIFKIIRVFSEPEMIQSPQHSDDSEEYWILIVKMITPKSMNYKSLGKGSTLFTLSIQ